MQKRLDEELALRLAALIIDLTAVGFYFSGGLSVLVNTVASAHALGIACALAGPPVLLARSGLDRACAGLTSPSVAAGAAPAQLPRRPRGRAPLASRVLPSLR
ncbi:MULTISPECIES: STAS domain-containing protein [Amycolatopsis]|uniref:STAS domain-containing protein n=1 Tax=Amycolatopsis TaxID=1813 RepID=UPI0035710A78